jgi:hypothetical protein
MSAILDATSLLPIGIVFDMVVVMIVAREFFREMLSFTVKRNFEVSEIVTCDW